MNKNRVLRVHYHQMNDEGKEEYHTRNLTVGELVDMEDLELKRFLFIHSNLGSSSDVDIKRFENDEKIAYYQFQDKYHMSKNGVIYQRGQLLEWIVYTKATKKVKLSRSTGSVYQALLNDHFVSYSHTILKGLGAKLTPTLCKKIMEGSVSTVADFIRYMRSYVLKKKDIPVEVIYKFLVANARHLLDVVEDPENLTDISELDADVDYQITSLGLFKCKLKDLKTLKAKYDEWNKKQMHRFLELPGQGDVSARPAVDF